MAHDINKSGTKVFFNLDYRQFGLVDNVKSPLVYIDLLIHKLPIQFITVLWVIKPI